LSVMSVPTLRFSKTFALMDPIPPCDPAEWRKPFARWLDSACVRHPRCFGGVGCLQIAFCEWEAGRDGVPCNRDTFELLLKGSGFLIGEVAGVLSEEHFTVDGALIQAWAAARSFKQKSDPPAPGAGSGHKGEVLLHDKVESTTDPDARLYKKASADKTVPGYQGHALIENRNGLVVAAEATPAATVAEREAALRMLDQAVAPKDTRSAEQKITLGADTQYQDEKFVQDLRDREVAPHISEYTQGGNMGKNSLTDQERQDARRAISQRKRKLIERVFGWSKLTGPMRQVKLRGVARVDWFWKLSVTAQNLMRMRRLIPIESPAH